MLVNMSCSLLLLLLFHKRLVFLFVLKPVGAGFYQWALISCCDSDFAFLFSLYFRKLFRNLSVKISFYPWSNQFLQLEKQLFILVGRIWTKQISVLRKTQLSTIREAIFQHAGIFLKLETEAAIKTLVESSKTHLYILHSFKTSWRNP